MDTKPCPFCACPKTMVESRRVHHNNRDGYHLEYAVICCDCGAQGPSDLSASGAIEMWNMRRTEFPNTTETEGA